MMLCGTVFAAEVTQTIAFKEGNGTSDSSTKVTTAEAIIADGSDFVSAITTADNVYNARQGRGIKLGTSSKTGTLAFTLANPVKPTKITFDARQYSETETAITVNGHAEANLTTSFDTYTINYDGNTEVSEISISTPTKRVYITNVKIYYEGGDVVTKTASPTITPNGGNFLGSIEVTLNHEVEDAMIFYTKNSEDWNTAISADPGDKITLTETTVLRVKAHDGENEMSDVVTATFTAIPSYATIAGLNALENNAVFAFTGEALIVAKPTAKHVYIMDQSGCSLIYDASGELTEAAAVGKTIAANWTGKVSIYNKLFELVPDKAIIVKDGDPISVSYPEATAADIIAANVNKVVTLKGITSYTVNGKNLTIKIGETEVVGYNQFGLDIAAAEEGKNYQMVGAISRYNDNIQFQPIEIKEVKVNPWVAPTIAGEDPVTGGKYKVMNVGSGKYLAMGKAWFTWNTTAILADDGFVATFTGDASSFTLTNNGNNKFVFTSGNDIQGDAMHADGTGNNIGHYGLTQLPNGNYRIHDAGGNAESKCWGYNSDFHATGIVAHADATAAGWNCEWIFVGDNAANLFNAKKALYDALLYAAENGVDTDEASAVYKKNDATIDELKAAAEKLTHETNLVVNTKAVEGATAEDPVETNFVVNGTFDTNGVVSPWQTTGGFQNQTTANNQQGAFTGNFFENWNGSAKVNKMYQVIEDIPNGLYTLKIAAFVNTLADPNESQYVFANNDKTFLTTGEPTNYTVTTIVTNNKIEIGLEQTTATANWMGIDNVSLLYAPVDLTKLIDAYNVALGAASAINAESDMNAEVKAALLAAIAAKVDMTNADSIGAATAALTEATSAATASIAAYAKVAEVLPKMKQLTEQTNVYTAEALENYYSKWVVKYDAKTLTTTEANALQDPFLTTGWHAAITCDDFLLSAWDTNPNFEDAPYYINTWSTEGVEGSNNYAGAEFGVPFFEYFADAAQSLGEKTLTATMNGLEKGDYEVTALVRVELKNDATEATGITLQANDGEAVNAADGAQIGTSKFYMKEVTATGTVGADGVLKIKFNVAAENTIHWLSFKNVMFAKKVVEVAHTWDFTKWSEATVTNLKADAAASKLEGWSDVEKTADAEADAEPTEASKDNCFWATVTPDENGELAANNVLIPELKGLSFNPTYATARSLAIAVNYPKALSDYAGPAYLWLGGGGKDVDCFVINNVKVGTTIKMGVESHKTTEGRGVQLFVQAAEGARGAKLVAPDGSEVAVPSVYAEQEWAVPTIADTEVCNVIVYNTKGCHIYFIDAEIGEAPQPVIADGLYDLTDDMFHVWSGIDENAVITDEQPGFGKAIGQNVKAGSLVYGNGSVVYQQYADITGYDSLAIVGTPTLQYRVLMNRLEVGNGGGDANGGALTEVNPVPNEKGVAFVDLTKYDKVRLNSIKLGWGSPEGFIDRVVLVKGAWDDTITGISTVKSVKMDGTIYNLNGQKVNKTQKGLYIVNGKKVVLK